MGALKPSDLARVVVDTTVQEKAVMFPTDARLINRARERLVRQARQCGVRLRQSYVRVGKLALIKHQRYAHAKQFKRDFKRRAAIEPVIGHLKDDHRMGRNYLAHSTGDAINAVLAAAGYNFRRMIQWLRLLLLRILLALKPVAQLQSA